MPWLQMRPPNHVIGCDVSFGWILGRRLWQGRDTRTTRGDGDDALVSNFFSFLNGSNIPF